MKQVIFKQVCLVFCFLISGSALADETIGYLTYSFSGTTATITGCARGEVVPKDLVIPETVEFNGQTFNVTKIGRSGNIGAFEGTTIKSLKINHMLDSIDLGAFWGCSKLQTIDVKATQIGQIAFYGCNNLKTAKISGTEIYSQAFQNCTALESVTLDGIKDIYDDAFSGCTQLKWIDFGKSLQRIGSNAFGNCTSLTYLVFPMTLQGICPTRSASNYRYNCWGDTGTSYSLKSTKSSFTGCDLIQWVIYLGKYVSTELNNIHTCDFRIWDVTQYTYSGTEPTPTYATSLSGGFKLQKIEIPSLQTNVGTYSISVPATFANDDISFDVEIPYTYTISPATLSAKVKDAERVYGEVNPQFEATFTGFIEGEDESVITNKGSFTTLANIKSNAGTYPVSLSGATAQNYIFEYEPGTLTVNKAPLTLSVNDKKTTYGSELPTFDLKYEGLKNNEKQPTWNKVPELTTTATKGSAVGAYPITISNADALNYEVTCKNGTLTIEKAPLSLKANSAQRLYGDANPHFSCTYVGLQNGETQPEWESEPKLETTATILSPVGAYPITILDAIASNYTISTTDGILTVGKAPLLVTPNDAERKYGDSNPVFTLSYEGLKNNETIPEYEVEPIITTNATERTPVGTYSISLNKSISAKNYAITTKTGKLTITKVPLSICLQNGKKVYGAANPQFGMEYIGLVNDETVPEWTTLPTITTAATAKSDVGEYVVTATGGELRNYEISEIISATLSITPAPLTININNATRPYYSEDPAFSFKCSGFVNGDDENVLSPRPILSTTATLESNVGDYDIKMSESTSLNYTISYVKGTLTITPRTLTASIGNYERLYNEENPTFEVQYNGFVGDENENVLKTKATASTTAAKTSDVGSYPINVSGGSADNYIFTYTPGTLTIKMAEQIVSWDQDLTNLQVGDQVELMAVASSGLPITYTIDNDEKAEIYTAGTKTYLDCLSSGRFLIRAVQKGNQNYYSSPRTSKSVIINGNAEDDPILTIIQAENGAVSTKVSKGSEYTFTIAAWEGWKIHSVTFNDEDVTNQLDETGSFTTPAINENATLNVAYEEDGGNAVKALSNSSVKIQGTSFGARVTGANDGDVIQVYTLDGVLQKSIKADEHVIDIPLTNQKVYIIKVGDKTVKLSI